uniref:hypothetical protein n=1 Tax=Castellaniella defragrans TaxID=75697 RepID=UPI00333E60F4
MEDPNPQAPPPALSTKKEKAFGKLNNNLLSLQPKSMPFSIPSLFRAFLCLGLVTCSFSGVANDGIYGDSTELHADLAQVLTCEGDRETYKRLANALTKVYYNDPSDPALTGWKKVEGNPYVAEFTMPTPVDIYGHSASTLIMAGDGIMAVLNGDLVDSLSKQLNLRVSDVPLASHIRTRAVQSLDLGHGMRVDVTQTVSTITSHPGKTLVGCEYRLVY